MENRPLNVTFVASDNSGPMFHILFLPSQYFAKYNLLQNRVVHSLEQIDVNNLDMVVFQRQYVSQVLMFIRMIKEKGIVVVTNTDDNIWNIPPNNPAKKVYTGDNLARYEAILREVHGVVTSTPYLKKLILPFNKNCYVERNLVEPFLNEFVSIGKDRGSENIIRLGWHLTSHHHDDYLIVEAALYKIIQQFPQVKLIFMGYKVPMLAKVPRNRWEFYDFVEVDAFYPALASLDFDLGIAPLVPNGFNFGQTHRKFSEYAMMGVPAIVSPVLPYLGLPEEGVALSSKTNDTKGWFEILSYAIEHLPEMEEMAKRAYTWVLENQNINNFIWEHAQNFYQIYNQVKNTNLKVPGHENDIYDPKIAEHIQNLRIVKGLNDI